MDSVVRIIVVNFSPNSEQMKLSNPHSEQLPSSTFSTNITSNQCSYWNPNGDSIATGKSTIDQNKQVTTWIDTQVSPNTLTVTTNWSNQYNRWADDQNKTILTTREAVEFVNEANPVSTE